MNIVRKDGGSTRKRISPPLSKIQLYVDPHWGPTLPSRRKKCKSRQPSSRTAFVITVATQPGMLPRTQGRATPSSIFGAASVERLCNLRHPNATYKHKATAPNLPGSNRGPTGQAVQQHTRPRRKGSRRQGLGDWGEGHCCQDSPVPLEPRLRCPPCSAQGLGIVHRWGR